MKRTVTPELLDDDLGTPAEIARSLVDLRHINQWFGGNLTTTTLLRKVAARTGNKRISLLEIGAGLGDVPLAARRTLARAGIEVDVTLVDRLWTHLPSTGIRAVSADALQLPFANGAFDVVSSVLFAHHFDPDALRRLCSEALRVCRTAVVINDLIRSRLHLGLVYLGLPLFRSRITWHDAPASVRAGYTPAELKEALKILRARKVDVARHFLLRMGLIIWK